MLPGGIDTWIPVVGVTTAALPAAVAAAVVLRRWRIGRGTPAAIASRTAWTEVSMVAGTLPWIWMILTPLLLVTAALGSATVEALQYVLDLGR